MSYGLVKVYNCKPKLQNNVEPRQLTANDSAQTDKIPVLSLRISIVIINL